MDSRPFIVQDGQGLGEPCLDANLLASYIDGRATPAERSRVEAHLARCDDCYSVFSETFQAQTSQAVAALEPDVKPASKGIGVGWRMTAGLAAAASVLLAIQVYRTNTRQQEDGSLMVALRGLDAAAGPYRSIEGRISGVTTYHALASPVRSGSSGSETPLAVREAALKVEAAAQGQSPEGRRALGVMYLTLGQPQRAADVVAPIAQSTTDPALLNDVAVVHLSRRGEGDAKRAMTLLEQVVEQDPNRAEPWFNLGLAAEAAGEPARARQAWARYLTIDPSSPWASEARAHLEKLR